MDRSKKSLTTAIAGAVALLLVLAGVGLAVVYTGAYNVAATEEHSSFGRWAFDTTFHRSVRARAADIEPPSDLGAMVERGPVVDREQWANGMRPKTPPLTAEAPDWDAKEVFWLVKHSAKMTGMPAFGPTHDEETLWGIVAMVKELPAMTPERYAALGEQHGETGAHGH